MITILKLISSMAATIISNCFSNSASKKSLKTQGDIFRFNTIMYIAALVMFVALAIGKASSLYTILMGLVFGLLTIITSIFRFRALATGPMHITILVTTCQMIIPTLSGVIMFGEPFSMGKFIAMLFLIFFVYLSLDKTKSGKVSADWAISCAICFFASGFIGVMQKIHQASVHKEEVEAFLAVAFACSFLFALISTKRSTCEAKFGVKEYIFAIVCGICAFIMNVFNLELSGVLPSQLFFPLANGVPLVLSSVIAIVVFKEKINWVQGIGLFGGIISLIVLAIA